MNLEPNDNVSLQNGLLQIYMSERHIDLDMAPKLRSFIFVDNLSLCWKLTYNLYISDFDRFIVRNNFLVKFEKVLSTRSEMRAKKQQQKTSLSCTKMLWQGKCCHMLASPSHSIERLDPGTKQKVQVQDRLLGPKLGLHTTNFYTGIQP